MISYYYGNLMIDGCFLDWVWMNNIMGIGFVEFVFFNDVWELWELF